MTLPASTARQLSEVKKAVINVVTLIVSVGTPTLNYLNVIHFPGDDVAIFSVIVGVAGAILHYFVPNTTTNPAVASTQSVTLVSPGSTALPAG